MTDSATGGEGSGFDVGPSIDELFGAVEEEPLESDSTTSGDEPADDVEDRTASEVFDQFRREADGYDVDGVLGEESPDDIITGASEEESTEAENEFLDEDELDELLLTGRRKEDEFLWVETDASSDDGPEGDDALEADRPASTEPEEASTDGAPEDDGPESESDLEPADESAGDRESEPDDALEREPDEADDALEAEPSEPDDADESEDDSSGLLDRVRSSLGL